MKSVKFVILAIIAMFSFCSCESMPPLITVRVNHGGGGGLGGPVVHRQIPMRDGYYHGPQGNYNRGGYPPDYGQERPGYGGWHPPDGNATFGGQRTNYMNFGEWQQRFGNGYRH